MLFRKFLKLIHLDNEFIAVSYTHLDVYKRQLERTPDKREVGGSSPLKPTKSTKVLKESTLKTESSIADKARKVIIDRF